MGHILEPSQKDNNADKSEPSATEDVREACNSDPPTVDEKALLRKLDLRLVPWLALLYLLNFLDRSSIGNAKVSCVCSFNCVGQKTYFLQLYNMEADIHITDTQYLIALTTFFFPYSFFEVSVLGR